MLCSYNIFLSNISFSNFITVDIMMVPFLASTMSNRIFEEYLSMKIKGRFCKGKHKIELFHNRPAPLGVFGMLIFARVPIFIPNRFF